MKPCLTKYLKSMKNSHKKFNALQAFFAKNIEKGEKLYER